MLASVTAMSTSKMLAAVGTPVNAPLAASVRPGGNIPPVVRKLVVGNVALTLPEGSVIGVIGSPAHKSSVP